MYLLLLILRDCKCFGFLIKRPLDPNALQIGGFDLVCKNNELVCDPLLQYKCKIGVFNNRVIFRCFLIYKEENLKYLAKEILFKLVNKSKEKPVVYDKINKNNRKIKKSSHKIKKNTFEDHKKQKENIKKRKNFRIKTVDLIKKSSKYKKTKIKKSNENLNKTNTFTKPRGKENEEE